MIRSIFYKEWIKSRWALLVLLCVFSGMMAYTFMTMARDVRVSGYSEVWEMIVQKGLTHVDYLKYLPLLAGVCLAVIQYAPEMSNKRLKLTLHLPLKESSIMLAMMSFGIIYLAVLFALCYIFTGVGISVYFNSEVVQWNLAALQPWLWSGLLAYILAAWICLEPVWKQRIFDGLMAIATLAMFYFNVIPGAYTPFLPCLIALVVVSISFTFYSLIRFKDGEQ